MKKYLLLSLLLISVLTLSACGTTKKEETPLINEDEETNLLSGENGSATGLFENENVDKNKLKQELSGIPGSGETTTKVSTTTAMDNESPKTEYFTELKRVSKNQIIWGANHFISKMPFDSSCWLIWDKGQRDFSLADGEMAWTSFSKAMRIKTYSRAKALQEGKIHPTQKPLALYDWQIGQFATEGMKILDTHFGSGSIALAVDKANRLDKMNLHLTACEIDKEYIDKAIKRISESIKQGTLSF